MRQFLLLFCVFCNFDITIAQVTDPNPATRPDIPSILSASPIPEKNGKNSFQKLLIARHNAAIQEISIYNDYIETAAGDTVKNLLSVLDAGERYVASGSELTSDPNRKRKLLEDYLELLNYVEHVATVRSSIGGMPPEVLPRVKYYILDCKIKIHRLHSQ